MITIKARIGDKVTDKNWLENFQVTSIDNAQQEIQEVIDSFNNTLKPYENPRELLNIIK